MREHFFGKYPELQELVADMTDEDIWRLNRGGHDPHKVYAAYTAAVKHKGQPTVILAKTVKGYGMGEAGEGQNIAHQEKKMTTRTRCATSATASRSRSPTTSSTNVPFFKPAEDSAGDEVPARAPRRRSAATCRSAGASPTSARRCRRSRLRARCSKRPGEREISTTMAFVQILSTLLRDKDVGKHIVPIVPDEARTFGMEGMFRQLGIYSPGGPALQAAGSPTS